MCNFPKKWPFPTNSLSHRLYKTQWLCTQVCGNSLFSSCFLSINWQIEIELFVVFCFYRSCKHSYHVLRIALDLLVWKLQPKLFFVSFKTDKKVSAASYKKREKKGSARGEVVRAAEVRGHLFIIVFTKLEDIYQPAHLGWLTRYLNYQFSSYPESVYLKGFFMDVFRGCFVF